MCCSPYLGASYLEYRRKPTTSRELFEEWAKTRTISWDQRQVAWEAWREAERQRQGGRVMCEVVKAYKQGLNEGRKEARELQRHLDNYAKRWLARGEEQDKEIKRLREALDLMVDTYKNGGWPTATIEIAKSALQESSVQEANDE
jgi:hypothetical protein